MRFKEFLAEAKHKRVVDMADIEQLLHTHCKDAMKLFHRPLWRGMTGGADAFILHGEAGDRVSKNSANYYTVIMDEFLPKLGYPRRGASIICANDENRDYIRGFGEPYAIFPFDGVPIGVCSGYDLWETRFAIGRHPGRKTIESWNELFSRYGLDSSSWDDFEDSLRYEMTETWAEGEGEGSDEENSLRREKGGELLEWFGPPEKIRAVFEKAYSPMNLDLDLVTSEGVDKFRGRREVWIGGKCIAIDRDIYNEMLKDQGLAP